MSISAIFLIGLLPSLDRCWTERSGESHAKMVPEPSGTAAPGSPVLILALNMGPESSTRTAPGPLRNGELDVLAGQGTRRPDRIASLERVAHAANHSLYLCVDFWQS